MTPTFLMPAFSSVASWRIGSTGCMSLTPVTLASGAAGSATRPAPFGSVTAVKTIGVSLSTLTMDWLVGVATVRMRSRSSLANFWAILAAVAMSP